MKTISRNRLKKAVYRQIEHAKEDGLDAKTAYYMGSALVVEWPAPVAEPEFHDLLKYLNMVVDEIYGPTE